MLMIISDDPFDNNRQSLKFINGVTFSGINFDNDVIDDISIERDMRKPFFGDDSTPCWKCLHADCSRCSADNYETFERYYND